MESSQLQKFYARDKRAMRVRKKLRGCLEKPRMSVFKSNKHLYVQLINDEQSATVASASTMQKAFREGDKSSKNKDIARQLGLKIAELAKEQNIQSVVFDRGHFKYHGLVAAIAEGAREGGLQF
jgi:large subunit ribosomal protein L18